MITDAEIQRLVLMMLPFAIFDIVMKGIAMWRAAKNRQVSWFIALFIVNSVGILPFIYLKFFQKK